MDPAFQDMDFADILRLEAEEHARLRLPGSRPTRCETCGEVTGALYRCRTCFWPRIICRTCTLTAHREQPLHRIEGVPDFKGITLAMLGLVVFLGHGGGKCPNGVRDADFTILGVDGAHDVILDFCGCDDATSRGMQLEAMCLHGWRSAHTALDFEIARHRMDLGLIQPERKRARKETKAVVG
ncbi:hypothetical protein C8F04DRAFT_1258007 [Mycena alexandri]|uniref:CxC2-like cysteine cluster KDZ transposase-associated domain-containing protein n=1 Tax=Mycena alexandri TaxID=1745969 RepID=A0AAD6X671_9AGAR|nr:hypothetical protein C8F04DRAFT_1258007 [Mycena alexandri]